MDERRTTDAKLEALEAMREDAMTTKTRARAAVKELAGQLAPRRRDERGGAREDGGGGGVRAARGGRGRGG